MGNISNDILTAAVSEAGGLGTIGAGTMAPEEVKNIILNTKERTSKPFAVNIPIKVSAYTKEIMDVCVQMEIPVVTLSAGNPAPFIPYFHQQGMKVMTVCASVHQAKKAEEAGADVIIGEGVEAAGINSPYETTTLALIPQMVQQVLVPVVAAGGISDGRSLAAMWMLGAQGVQMGTRFIATEDAPFHPLYKEKIIQANDTATMMIGRSYGQLRRVLKTEYAEKLAGREKAGMSMEQYRYQTSERFHHIGAIEGKESEGFMNAGQISGAIQDLPTVAELLKKMMHDAQQAINEASNQYDPQHSSRLSSIKEL